MKKTLMKKAKGDVCIMIEVANPLGGGAYSIEKFEAAGIRECIALTYKLWKACLNQQSRN